MKNSQKTEAGKQLTRKNSVLQYYGGEKDEITRIY